MKFTLFHYLTIIACILTVLCVRVDAQDPPCDLGILCDDSEAQLDQLLDEWIASLPENGPDTGSATAPATGSGTTLARRQSLYKRDFKETLASSGKKLLHAVKDVMDGLKKDINTYGETNFRDDFLRVTKAGDSACQTEIEVLKAMKDAANAVTWGVLGTFCKCMSIVRPYNTPDELTQALRESSSTVMKPCSDQAPGFSSMLDTRWRTGPIGPDGVTPTDPDALGAGTGQYLFAHCEKDGSDYTDIQHA
ncbi:hypothetical protein BGX33_002629, partial [Mortierella sp. NVP41]